MSRLSYKTLFIILLFLLIPIVFLIRINQKSKKISAAWWDDMWHYRQAINISSHSSTESNVYISTTINLGSSTKAQADDGDFRFTNQAGNLLPYYISAGTGTTSITFHINFDSFPAGAQTIYAYYGNPSANNGFSVSDFSTAATNYTIGSLGGEEIGGAPVAYWKFDENIGTTVFDSSSSKKNGILTGAPDIKQEEDCISGKCLFFDGTNNDYVSINDSGVNDPLDMDTKNFTVSYWGKAIDFTNPKSLFPMIEGDHPYISGTGHEGWSIADNYVSTGSVIAINDGTNKVSSTLTFNVGSRPPDLKNKWVHFAFVFDRSNGLIKAYINGVQQSSTLNISSVTGSISNSTGLSIGYGTGWKTHGYMDDFKIYPYARTPEQIKQDYATQVSNVNVDSSRYDSLSEGLMAYWKFDEGVGTTSADSTGNYIATLKGGTLPAWTTGKIGIGLSFNGANYVSTSLDVDTIDSKTFSAWVYRNSTNTWDNFILNASAWDSAKYCGIHGYGDKLSLYQAYGTGSSTYMLREDTGSLPLSQWFHIAGTIDKPTGVMRIYVNGKMVKESTQDMSGVTFYNTGQTTYIAGGPIANSINGMIDEVRVYNRALSPAEIKQLYDTLSPIAEWKFEEGVGTTAYDTSGNNNNGILVNNPIWTTGKIGKALSFNGTNSYVNVPSLTWTPTQFTVEFWLKPTTCTDYNQLIQAGGWGQFVFHTTSTCAVYVGTDVTNRFTPTNLPANTVTLNQWQHFAFTFNKGSGKFYKNGSLLASKTGMANPTTWGSFNIGSNAANTINGSVDNVMVYDYELTQDQILDDYHQGSPTFSVASLDVGSTSTSALYCVPGSTDPCSPPIAQWNFEESVGTSAFDSSSSGNNGVFIGATLPTRSIGKIGTALSFNGLNNYVLLPTSGGSDTKGNLGFADTDNFTLSLWYKGTDTGTGDGSLGKTLIGRNSNDIYANFVINGGYVEYIHYNGGWQHNLKSTTQVSDNKWHYISFVNHSNETGDLYIDGIKQISGLSSSIDSATRYFKADNLMNGYNNKYTSGQLDDVRIYNYARTPAQIAWDYNQGAPIGWWKFDECQGSIAHDSSGIGNTGAIVIGASGTQTSVGTCTTSGTAWGVGATGKINSSLGFDGTDDYIQIPNIISGDNTHTILFWAKPTSYNKVWIDMSGDSGYSFVQISPTNLYVGYSPTTPSYRTYAYTFNLNNWYHIAISKNNTGNNVNVYVNGNLLNVYTGSVGDMNSGSIIYLGKFHNNGYNIGGQLDDARIYNYALTTEQIKQIYNGGTINFN